MQKTYTSCPLMIPMNEPNTRIGRPATHSGMRRLAIKHTCVLTLVCLPFENTHLSHTRETPWCAHGALLIQCRLHTTKKHSLSVRQKHSFCLCVRASLCLHVLSVIPSIPKFKPRGEEHLTVKMAQITTVFCPATGSKLRSSAVRGKQL